ncbi:MAG: polyphosphate kinase 2 [Proteobacteria bacterium]|nr:polyphosphate kinase 2 [Pseudomonadota bacterium]
MSHDDHEATLKALQVELVSSQLWTLESGRKILVVFEGRDAAGKDGVIRRITEHLSVRATRVTALPKPSDRERSQWFFQRYAAHLPAAGEWVIFNRSWYNRAGVERVMEFSTPVEQTQFLDEAPVFERMLVEAGVTLLKYWLDISKPEQARRLERRRSDPLKRLKVSPLDAVAQEKWEAYSAARDDMLKRTHTAIAPWWCVRADHKGEARLNVIRHLLHAVAAPELSPTVARPDPKILFPFELEALTDGRLAR